LANSKAIAESWYPRDPKKRAQVDLFYDWFDAHSAELSIISVFHLPKSLEDAKATVDKNLKELEDVFLSQKKFVASDDKLTIADLSLAFILCFVSEAYDFSKFTKVTAYYESVVSFCPKLKEELDTGRAKRLAFVVGKKRGSWEKVGRRSC